jgi:hypothetical protein
MSSAHESNGNGQAKRRSSQSEPRGIIEMVAERPIASLAIAAAAGFVVGGGARRTGGLTILALLLQVAMRESTGESSSLGDLIGAALGVGNDA